MHESAKKSKRTYQPAITPRTHDSTLAIVKIGKVAQLTGLSPSALRLYENLGLVLPFKEKKGQRLYSLDDINWILQLRAYFKEQHLGPRALSWAFHYMPLKELRGMFLPNDPCWLEFAAGEAICWQVHADDAECRKICRACPTYQNKALALNFRAFEILLRLRP